MKSILISMLVSIARRLIEKHVTPGLYDRVKTLVVELDEDKDMTGDQKRKEVRRVAKEEFNWVELRNDVIDAIIQVVILSLKGL